MNIRRKIYKKMGLFIIGIILLSVMTYNAYASSYLSYNDIDLDYKKGIFGTYGEGKNGYSFVRIYKVSKDSVTYRNTKLVSEGDSLVFKEYGKKKTVGLTAKTKYYLGNPSRINVLRQKEAQKDPYRDTTLHTKFYKSAKWLTKTTKANFRKKYTQRFTFIKVKKNKVVKIVSRLQTDN